MNLELAHLADRLEGLWYDGVEDRRFADDVSATATAAYDSCK